MIRAPCIGLSSPLLRAYLYKFIKVFLFFRVIGNKSATNAVFTGFVAVAAFLEVGNTPLKNVDFTGFLVLPHFGLVGNSGNKMPETVDFKGFAGVADMLPTRQQRQQHGNRKNGKSFDSSE